MSEWLLNNSQELVMTVLAPHYAMLDNICGHTDLAAQPVHTADGGQ